MLLETHILLLTLLRGFVAGTLGTAVMAGFGALIMAIRHQSGPDQSPPTNLVRKIAGLVSQRPLSARRAGIWSLVLQFSFGSAAFITLSAFLRVVPGTAVLWGLILGTGLWFGGDVVVGPAIGISQRISKTPLSITFQSLAAHLLYGVTGGLLLTLFRRVHPL